MKFIDPKLGVPLPEKGYGGNCLLYDPGDKTDPFHNIWDKMDGFVPAHFIGWYIKFLLAELNTFYLKFVLWMPPEHCLVLLRLVFFVNVGGVAMREIYDFMDDP
ncbi:UNVERIFIED_CONTAM: hypothetical protein FKN15_039388 [Acipenser sinensis]